MYRGIEGSEGTKREILHGIEWRKEHVEILYMESVRDGRRAERNPNEGSRVRTKWMRGIHGQ